MEFSFIAFVVLLYIVSSMQAEPCAAAGRPMKITTISVSGVMFCSQCSQEKELNVPMPGAHVELQCRNRPPSSEATDENGLFTFTMRNKYQASQGVSGCKVLLSKRPNSQCDVSENVTTDAALIKLAAPIGSSLNEIKYSVGAFVYQTACRQSLLFHHLEGTYLLEESPAKLHRVTITLPPLPPLPPLPAITLPPLPAITLPPLPPLPPLPSLPPLPPLPSITLPPLPSLPPLPPLPAITLSRPPLPPLSAVPPLPPLPATTLPPTPANSPLSPMPPTTLPPLSAVPPLPPLPATTLPPTPATSPLSPMPPTTLPPLSAVPSLPPLPATTLPPTPAKSPLPPT